MAESHFSGDNYADVTIVRLADGDYTDRLIGSELQQQLIAFCKEETPQKLLISFDAVDRFSSEMINALLKVREHLTSQGGKMALCELLADIRQIFQLLKLEGSVFPIYDTQEEALQDFAGS